MALMSAGRFAETNGGVVQELGATARCKISSMAMHRTQSGDKEMIIQNADASDFGDRVTDLGWAEMPELRFFTRDSSKSVRKLDKVVHDSAIVTVVQSQESFLSVFFPPATAEKRRQFIDALRAFTHVCEPIW
jgi:hypothetical protein